MSGFFSFFFLVLINASWQCKMLTWEETQWGYMGTLYHLCNISENLQLFPKQDCRIECLNYNTVLYFIKILNISYTIVAVQSQSSVWLFANPWTAARQAALSFAISFMSIELVMLSHQLICRPLLLLPSIFSSFRVTFSESALQSGGQSSGASASVLPVSI